MANMVFFQGLRVRYNYIKIYGMMRTGSCWLHTLISDNFKQQVLTNSLGWKHSYPVKPNPSIVEDPQGIVSIRNAFEQNKILYIYTIKNPYSWILSMCKRRRWDVNRVELDFLQELCFKWNAFANEYVDLQGYDSIVLKYEDLLYNTISTLESL